MDDAVAAASVAPEAPAAPLDAQPTSALVSEREQEPSATLTDDEPPTLQPDDNALVHDAPEHQNDSAADDARSADCVTTSVARLCDELEREREREPSDADRAREHLMRIGNELWMAVCDASAVVQHHAVLFGVYTAIVVAIVAAIYAALCAGAPCADAACCRTGADACDVGAMGRRLASALPLAQGYPADECEPLAAGVQPDAALVGALRTHLCVPGAPLALTARHVGRRECVAAVRPARGLAPVVVVNARRAAASVETRASAERDSLCRIDRAVTFTRPRTLALRYTDERGRAVEREFEGDAAAAAAHALDVLEALRVCED